MTITFIMFSLFSALLHVFFFKLESIDFMKAKVLKRFGLNQTQGAIVKIWAFNQGFYNLFLALGLFYSIYVYQYGDASLGLFLARFVLLTITGAGLVLLFSSPKKYIAALTQSLPALIAWVSSHFMS